MAEEMKAVDVEKIMEEIRAEIREKGYKASQLSFRDIDGSEKLKEIGDTAQFSLEELEMFVQQVHLRSRVDWYQPVDGGKLAGLFKKVIRRLCRFMLIPLVEKQNESNEAVFLALNQLLLYVREQEATIADLQKQLDEEKAQ